MKKIYLHNQIYSFLFLIFITPCFGQTDGNMFRCGIRDKTGNLWFSNIGKGVYRYNAVSSIFTNFSKKDGLNDNNIESIFEDKAGNIWFANLYNGVCRYDGKSITHFTEKNGLCNDTITYIYEDKKGNIWFGIEGSKWGAPRGGVCRYDGKSFTHYAIKNGFGNVGVWTIVEDNDGNIWVGSRNGLFRYHSPSGRFINYTYKVNSSN